MSIENFGEKKQAAEIQQLEERMANKTKTLGEGESSGWENERQFGVVEVVEALKELGVPVEKIEVTKQTLSAEGVLLILDLRVPGDATGYSYELKGKHGNIGAVETTLQRIDYAGPDSTEVDYSEIIADFKDGAWVKQ